MPGRYDRVNVEIDEGVDVVVMVGAVRALDYLGGLVEVFAAVVVLERVPRRRHRQDRREQRTPRRKFHVRKIREGVIR